MEGTSRSRPRWCAGNSRNSIDGDDPMIRRLMMFFAAAGLAGGALCADKGTSGLEMQKARAEGLVVKGKKSYYPADKWDLSDLPAYAPQERIAGTIRLWGSNYIVDGNLGEHWEKAVREFHPHAKLG